MSMKVVYVLNMFPKISETFILNEIVQAQKEGVVFEIVAFADSREDRVHPDVVRAGPVSYFAPPRTLTAFLDHCYFLVRSPRGYFKAFRMALDSSHGITQLFFKSLHNVRLIERMKPDHLHAHFGTWTADMAMLTGALLGVPYTFTTHSYDIFSFPPGNFAVKSRLAKRHITISRYNKRYLVEKFNVRPEDIEIVHCGIDWTKIPEVEAQPASNRIITVARLEKPKGLEHLIRAYGRLKERRSDFEAIIIGDGTQRVELEALIRELGLEGHVKLLGHQTQDKIFETLLTCKLMVLTSTVEGIPVSLMEAMAFKVPVIASNITGIPELIEDGKSGFLVDPHDTNGLLDKIERLLDDEALWRGFSGNGYKKVVKEFSLSDEVAKLLTIWKS